MNLQAFLLYQIGWYLFATAAAFTAALLFWQKGRSMISGREPGTGFGVRLSGAAGIFVAVLLVLHFINPLQTVVDSDKLLLVYSTTSESEIDGEQAVRRYTVGPSQLDRNLFAQDATPELISADHVYPMKKLAGDNAYGTTKPVPAGIYFLRLVGSDGEVRTEIVEVPASKG